MLIYSFKNSIFNLKKNKSLLLWLTLFLKAVKFTPAE